MAQFQKGKSGNPAGKPKGARHKATLAMEALLEGDADAITKKAIELAKAGDGPAIRLCMDRLLPVRRDRHVTFTLPEIKTIADMVEASNAIVQAVADGELTPSEAADVAKVLDTHTKTLQALDLEQRITKLEATLERKT